MNQKSFFLLVLILIGFALASYWTILFSVPNNSSASRVIITSVIIAISVSVLTRVAVHLVSYFWSGLISKTTKVEKSTTYIWRIFFGLLISFICALTLGIIDPRSPLEGVFAAIALTSIIFAVIFGHVAIIDLLKDIVRHKSIRKQ